MPPSSKASKPKPALKQSALSFPTKRSGSAADKDAKGKGKAAASQSDSRKSSTVPPTPVPRRPRNESSDEEDIAKRTYQAEDDDAGASVEGPPVKRRRVGAGSSKGKGKRREDTVSDSDEKGIFRSRASIENTDGAKAQPAKPSVEGLPHLDVNDKKGRWNKHFGEVREKMGNIPPIHAKGLTKIDHILRVFDLSYEYGPCIGVTRLQRWERADALGLNPPIEVKEILMTKEATEKSDLAQCVFYGDV